MMSSSVDLFGKVKDGTFAGTPITTAIEERNLHAAAKKRVEAAELRVEAERDLRAEAEARAVEETHRRQALERELEQLRRQLENR